MDAALAIAIILATSVNVAGVVVFWRFLRGYWLLLTRPRVVIAGAQADRETAEWQRAQFAMRLANLPTGTPHPVIPRKSALFVDRALHRLAQPASTLAFQEICRVTEVSEPSRRTVAPVTMDEAKTAKLVVCLVGDRIRNHDLYRQGDRMQYGSLDTAQVFNGLADLQRRAPQTYTNPDREVLAVTLTQGKTRYEEVEVG